MLHPASERLLLPGDPGVVAPDQPREVNQGPVRFFVEFYRAAVSRR